MKPAQNTVQHEPDGLISSPALIDADVPYQRADKYFAQIYRVAHETKLTSWFAIKNFFLNMKLCFDRLGTSVRGLESTTC
jgi:hypothetical protein